METKIYKQKQKHKDRHGGKEQPKQTKDETLKKKHSKM